MILLTAVLMKEKFNYMLVTYLLSSCDYLKEPNKYLYLYIFLRLS